MTPGFRARLFGFIVVVGIVVVGGVSQLGSDPSAAIGTFVVGGVGIGVASVLILAIFWTGSEDARSRRAALKSQTSTRWIADVRIDQDSLDAVLSRNHRSSSERPPKDYALAVAGQDVQIWGTAEDTDPLATIPLSRIAGLQRAPVLDAVWMGDLVLQLVDPTEELELALNGPLWGAIAPNEAAIERLRSDLRLVPT